MNIKKTLVGLGMGTLLFSGCASSMPLQGLSTGNYAYRPATVRTYESVVTDSSGNTRTYRSSSSYQQPENAFKSLRKSAWNLQQAARSVESIRRAMKKW